MSNLQIRTSRVLTFDVPDVHQASRTDWPVRSRGAVIWLTGLSGAGKSTIADRLCLELTGRGRDVESLDGDVIRSLFPATGFSAAERDAHVRRLGFLASRLEERGVIVVAALISPLRESRAFARRLCRNFVEVHIATPLEICESRDPKGLYARARRGELTHFTGIDDVYEPPLRPELVIDTSFVSVNDSVASILDYCEPRLLTSATSGSASRGVS